MFHLFKKVYVNYDNRINVDYDRFVVSQENGVGMLQDQDRFSYGELLGSARSVSDLIGEGKQFSSYLQFFEKLNEAGDASGLRVMVYADKEAFFTIMIAWLKTILPNITADAAYRIFRLYFTKDKIYGISPVVDVRRNYNIDATAYNVEKSLFEAEFATVNINRSSMANFVDSVKETISLDYLLASYLYDGSRKEGLRNRLLALNNVDCQKLLFETKSLITGYIGRKQFQELLGINDLSLETVDTLISLPRLAHWFNPEIWLLDGIGEAHENSKIDFSKIDAVTLQKLVDDINLINVQWEQVSEDSPSFRRIDFIQCAITNALTDADFDAIMDYELNVASCCNLLRPPERDRLNIYFIDYILNSYTANQLENLRPYTL